MNTTYSRNLTISFHPVVASTAGNYTCTASHWAGFNRISKYFVIVPKEELGVIGGANSSLKWLYSLIPIFGFTFGLLTVSLYIIQRQRRVLNDAEFRAFLEGREAAENNKQIMAANLAYNTKYEVEKRQIKIGIYLEHLYVQYSWVINY